MNTLEYKSLSSLCVWRRHRPSLQLTCCFVWKWQQHWKVGFLIIAEFGWLLEIFVLFSESKRFCFKSAWAPWFEYSCIAMLGRKVGICVCVCDSGLRFLESGRELLLVREVSGFDQKLSLRKWRTCYMAGDTGGRTWPTEVHLLLQVKEACIHKDFRGGQGFTWSGFSKLKEYGWGWLPGAAGARRTVTWESSCVSLANSCWCCLYYFVLRFHLGSTIWDQHSDFTSLEQELAASEGLLSVVLWYPHVLQAMYWKLIDSYISAHQSAINYWFPLLVLSLSALPFSQCSCC